MNELNEVKKLLGNDWEQFERFYHTCLQSRVELLNTVNNYIYDHKGKQLRPVLALLSAKVFGECTHDVQVAAVAVEMIHSATLLHDDVVDNSDQRHGVASIKKMWKSNIAVLCGDYWLSTAFQLLVNNRCDKLFPLLISCMATMSEGEMWQLDKARKLDTTEEDYFSIIGKKTAALLAVSMTAGAMTAGADDNDSQRIYDIGYTMGIAFQIRDDIFDYEKNSLAGKPAGNDIRERKLTLPLLYALQQADEKEQKYILKQVERAKNKSRSVARVIDFVQQKKGLEYAEKTMLQYSEKAKAMMLALPESTYREALIALANFMTTRKK